MDQREFYELYQQYSTADLINIVREKDNYQPAAVLAAERLLQERGVTSVDKEEADQFIREKEEKRMAVTARVDSYKAVVADWVEPLAKPSAELQPYKWYRIFLVVYGLSYGWELYGFIRHLIVTRSILLNLDQIVVEDVSLVWATFLFVLILKRRKWGWILIVVDNTALVLMQLFAFISALPFSRIGVDSTPSLYLAVFHLAFVLFLWRQPMAEFFGVEVVVKKRALGVGAGIGVIFILFALHAIL